MSNPQVEAPWTPDTYSLAPRFALVRHRMGWNQKEASKECGLAESMWARIENGVVPRNLIDVIEKVVERTGVSREWLAFGPGQRPGGLGDSRRAAAAVAKRRWSRLLPEEDSNFQPAGFQPKRFGREVVLLPSARPPVVEWPAADAASA